MRILVVHNAYQQRGGEDVVVENEVALLGAHGHSVQTWIVSNDAISGVARKAITALFSIFSPKSYCDLMTLLRTFCPDVVHVHNFFPLLSPSVFYACFRMRVPVVMTLHNYRIICPTATLFLDGRLEARSISDGPWWAVKHAAYKDSYLATFFLAAMISVHRRIGTWRKRVSCFITLSHEGRDRFVAWGLPENKVAIKPNFVQTTPRVREPSGAFLYVGRLSKEKGLGVLLQAASVGGFTVRVAGDGPLDIERRPNVIFLGSLLREQVESEMSRSLALVVPSIAPESFGMVVVEAFAQGLPVIASRIGALQSLVEDGVTGLLIDPNDEHALCDAMRWAAGNPGRMAEMGKSARRRYEEHFMPDSNHCQLISIYHAAIAEMKEGRARA